MIRIGVDFGTTYTSGFSWQNERYESIFAAQSGQSPLQPSIALVCKDKNNNDTVQFGFKARETLNNPHFASRISRVFRGFKMLLGKLADDSMIVARGYDVEGAYSPDRVARDFLEHWVRMAYDRCGEEPIEKMVVGIPQIWFDNEYSISARASLSRILDDVKSKICNEYSADAIGEIVFESEPALACAYYADNYRRTTGDSLNGHMLLIDYGGGTLDINLCKVTHDGSSCEISVIARTGKGINDPEHGLLGKAGMAFIQDVIRRAKQDQEVPEFERHLLEQSLESRLMDTENMSKLRSEFKMAVSDEDCADLDASDFDELSDGTIITYGMLREAYDAVIRPTLNEALQDIDTQMENKGINIRELQIDNHVKIVLAGGFCNFCLTKQQVYDHYQIASKDPRTQGIVTSGSGLEYAIAYGAALVAADVIKIKRTYPYTLGLVDIHGNMLQVFEFGDDMEYDKPQYAKRVGIDRPVVFLGSSIPELYFDSNGSKKYTRSVPKNDYWGDFKLKIDNLYLIGFSLDSNLNIKMWLARVEEMQAPHPHYAMIGEPEMKQLPTLDELFGGIRAVGYLEEEE